MSTDPASPARRSSRWFFAWLLVGGLGAITIVTGLSVGIFVLPLTMAVLIWVVHHAPRQGETAGLPAGAGLALVAVAGLNWGYKPCPEHGSSGLLEPGQTSFSCGGLDPYPWLLAGTALVAIGVGVYVAWRLRRS